MKYSLRLLIIIFAFSSSNTIAGAGWSGEATIKGIYVLNEETALIKLSNSTNPHNCDTNGSGDAYVNPTTQKTWFTSLLSAYMAGKTVDLYYTPSCKGQWSGTSYSEIGHVRLK